MRKFKVTNTSQSSEKGPCNVFLTEAGKLLKPGEHCAVNRVDQGTRAHAEVGVLKIEEGSFAAAPIFPPAEPSPPADNVADKSDAAKAEEVAAAEADAEVAAAAKAQVAAAEADAEVAAAAKAQVAAAEADAEVAAAAKAAADEKKSSKRSDKKRSGRS